MRVLLCQLTSTRYLCLCDYACVFAQGSKREHERAEKRANGTMKKWNHGAPLSKKSKGLGVQKGENGRFVSAGEKPRDPQLPTSVPMPSAVEDINDLGMRAMWEADGAGDAAAAAMPVEPLE